MDRLEKEEEAARLAREIQLRQSQKLQVGEDAMILFVLSDWCAASRRRSPRKKYSPPFSSVRHTPTSLLLYLCEGHSAQPEDIPLFDVCSNLL